MDATGTRRVMGTTATISVVGCPVAPTALFGQLDDLERRWSRFRPDSELNRLNAVSGSVGVVSPQLLVLVRHLVDAHRLTGGRLDPTLHDQMNALGYDRTLWSLPDDGPAVQASEPGGRCARIMVLPAASSVRLPSGTRLDPGALGKGLAADLIAAEAMTAGASGVLVDIGGDIVVRGAAADGGPWRIALPETPERPGRVAELFEGAVATSDSYVRRWTRGGVTMGHILDPATGRPIDRHIRATAIAGAGWAAEAAATAAVVAASRGEDPTHARWAEQLGATIEVSEPEMADA